MTKINCALIGYGNLGTACIFFRKNPNFRNIYIYEKKQNKKNNESKFKNVKWLRMKI